jgi:hypothetical protein
MAMITRIILLTVLAASDAEPATNPGDQPIEPPDDVAAPEDQHFCCKSVDAKNRTGDGCIMASKEDVKLCNANILYCPGFYTLDTNGFLECPK